MLSIESSGFPLAFKAAAAGGGSGKQDVFVTRVRSLEGMQKEAVVTGQGGETWRLACDEGPYLNGKDLAPFPLAFFSAGMQFSFLSQFVRGARERSVPLAAVELEQDNFYTMEGSFLRGDAKGGAMPAELRLKVESSAGVSEISELVDLAATSSPAEHLMRTVVRNTFALTLNGEPQEIPGLQPSRTPRDDPADDFEGLSPAADGFLSDIVARVKKGEAVHGVEGGAGSSLKAEQKRTLHIHCEGRWLEEMLMETVVHLYKPIGSSFRFVCDENGKAPAPLAYLSAGIGFCYMTQLGRYAKIVKQELDAYRIVQETALPKGGVGPVDTQVFLEASLEEADDASRLVSMGQQTCFLHAAMRGEFPSLVSVQLNGKEL